jgi:hypothetical protein
MKDGKAGMAESNPAELLRLKNSIGSSLVGAVEVLMAYEVLLMRQHPEAT